MSGDLPQLTPQKIEQIEECMLKRPQVDCPTVHHFGPGIYIREMTAPADTLAIGHCHKHTHINILLKGEAHIINADGSIKVMKAPTLFLSPPGRKIAYFPDECVWQNIHATDETDIDKLEEIFIDKSDAWKANAKESDSIDMLLNKNTRQLPMCCEGGKK